MDRLTRRETIAIGAGGLTAAGLIGQPAHAAFPVANVAPPDVCPISNAIWESGIPWLRRTVT